MSEKRFDTILGKQRARARLRDFIGKHLHERKQARVLCLPGANGREIEHVYRKLGFRDENIFGIESDADALPAVRAHYPRITVFHGTVNAFVESYVTDPNAPPLDVVSLDYCGNFDLSRLFCLRLLQTAGKLADNVIIATNFFAGREQAKRQRQLKDTVLAGLLGGGVSSKDRVAVEKTPGALDKILDTATEQAANTTLTNARDVAPFIATINELTHFGPYAYLYRCGLRALPRSWTSRIVDKFKLSSHDVFTESPFEVPAVHMAKAREEVADCIRTTLTQLRRSGCDRLIGNDASGDDVAAATTARQVLSAFQDKRGMAHVPVHWEPYSYVNDVGHRMVSDYMHFRHHRQKLAQIPDGVCIEDGTLIPAQRPEDFNTPVAYLRYVLNIATQWSQLPQLFAQQREHTPRIDLGGGALPFDSERTKARVVELLKKGRTDDEILARFPITVGTLRALKANITMGRL